MSTPGRARVWALVWLAAYAVLVALVLFSPVGFGDIIGAIGNRIRYGMGMTGFGFGWIEFAANILMFIPLGWLLTVLFRARWMGFAVAAAISIGAELLQVVIPMRVPSLRDVIANLIGALVGAGLAAVLVHRQAWQRRAGDSVERVTDG